MSAELMYWLAAGAALSLACYLVYALLYAEEVA